MNEYCEKICKNVPIGFMAINSKRQVLYINDYARKMLNLYSKIDHISDLPDYLDALKSRLINVPLYNEKKDLFVREHSRLIYIEMYLCSSSPADPEEQNQVYFISLIDKTSDLKKLDTIKAMQDELFQFKNLAAIGTMISGIAHELNNPISGISMSAQLAESSLTSIIQSLKEARHNLEPEDFNALLDSLTYSLSEIEHIKLNTVRSARLVGGLLNYSKREKLDLEHCILFQLLQETLDITRSQHVFTGAKININCPLEIKLNCDKLKIQQVIYNILKNAAEASPENPEININCTTEKKYVRIAICDNGCGIPHSNLNQLFTPFFTTKAGIGGTGLGLSISHRIVERHGGKIKVNSTVNEGSEFIVILPMNLE
jgi:signal transduction histidine kinase